MDTDTEKKRLTDFQLRLVQAAGGLVSAAALIVSIYISNATYASQNILLQYLFIIVFVILMIIKRQVETRLRIRMSFYNLVLIDGILAGILSFFIVNSYAIKNDLKIDETWRVVIIAGVSLLIVSVGILLPLVRYLRKKAAGTLAPMRFPEKKEETPDDNAAKEFRELTTAQKIELMAKELEQRESPVSTREDEKEDKDGQ